MTYNTAQTPGASFKTMLKNSRTHLIKMPSYSGMRRSLFLVHRRTGGKIKINHFGKQMPVAKASDPVVSLQQGLALESVGLSGS